MMVNTIDMQEIRYLNLFGKITRVQTRFCFIYNNMIVFCVPKNLVSKAIGENGKNIKKISKILGKRIKIVSIPKGIKDVESFIQSIISPLTFKSIKITDNEVAVTGGTSKAALIGRNKRRLIEMHKVIKDFFGKEFKVI